MVARRHLNDTRAFRPNGTTRFEVLHQAVSDDLAFWAGFQIATVQMGGASKPTAMKIRVSAGCAPTPRRLRRAGGIGAADRTGCRPVGRR
jgi:hypothetical protein